MRLWFGAGWGARPIKTHDSGSCHPILPEPGNFDGLATLFSIGGCVVGGMYIRWATWTAYFIPSTKSRTTIGANYWTIGNTVIGGYAACMWRCTVTYVTARSETTIPISSLYAQFPCNTRSRSSFVSNVGVWSGKFFFDFINFDIPIHPIVHLDQNNPKLIFRIG